LIVVIAILAVLVSIIVVATSSVMEKAKVSAAGSVQRQMTKAVEMYFVDMGFYPPDVNRGWDPGLVKPEPWSPNAPSEGGFSTPGTNCSHCPSNWVSIVSSNWNGPYLASWPAETPWGGKYDYNYWSSEASRPGCVVSPGIYMGVQKDYNDNKGEIPVSAEQKMINWGFDIEIDCIDNGEAQMLLYSLE